MVERERHATLSFRNCNWSHITVMYHHTVEHAKASTLTPKTEN